MKTNGVLSALTVFASVLATSFLTTPAFSQSHGEHGGGDHGGFHDGPGGGDHRGFHDERGGRDRGRFHEGRGDGDRANFHRVLHHGHFRQFHHDGGFVIAPGWGCWGVWGCGYPYYYPPSVYPAPMPESSVYIEEGENYGQDNVPLEPANPAYYWYRCDNPGGYYPYVKECPEGWQRVAPGGVPLW